MKYIDEEAKGNDVVGGGGLTRGAHDVVHSQKARETAGAGDGENPFRCPAGTSPSDTPPPRLAPPVPAISLPPCGDAPLQTLSSPDSETSPSSHRFVARLSAGGRSISCTQDSLGVSRDCALPPRLA